MNKKVSIIIFLLLFLISTLILTNYYLSQIYINKANRVTNPIGKDGNSTNEIYGKLIWINDLDRERLSKIHSVPLNQITFLIESSVPNSYSYRYYYIHSFDNPSVKETFTSLDSATQASNCIKLIPSKVISNLNNQQIGFYNSIESVDLNNFEVTNDLNCYRNYGPFPTSNISTIVKGDITIFTAMRPAYDIGYDFITKIPGKQAKEWGYNNASGLSYKDTDLVSIDIAANSTEILKKIKQASIEKKPLSIIGNLEWGYAESVVLSISQILD